MGQTATEKTLEAACGADDIVAGDTVEVEVDRSWVHETQFEIFRENFEEFGGEVWDRDRVMFMIDHFPTPSTQEQADRLCELRDYAAAQDIDVVSVGIKHQAWRMLGLAQPGAIMAGPDSHTPTAGALGAFATCVGPTDTAIIWNTGQIWLTVPETIRFEIFGSLDDYVTPRDIGFHLLERFGTKSDYFAEGDTIEFGGETIGNVSLDGRQTLSNMATEMGVANALIEPDDRLRRNYLEPKGIDSYEIFTSDEDTDYREHHKINVESLEPKVAFPHSPSNIHNVGEAEGIELDRLFLGSCANGHLEDLQLAADILEENRVDQDVELLVTPATDEIRQRASAEGILDTFEQTGARIGSGYCSACPGYEGVLAAGETCLATSTRNYRGRMGHRDSDIYLCSPAVLAASAITGEITDPRSLGNRYV